MTSAYKEEYIVPESEPSRRFDTVVVGLGKTGFSCARYLSKQGINFAVVDSRAEPPMLQQMCRIYPNIPLYLGKFSASLFVDTNNLLVSPGVSLQEDAISHASHAGVSIYGDIELFCRNTSVPIIAITGSNGKSTVTKMVAEMLRRANFNIAVGGNFGTPVLDLLTEQAVDFYVLELSSFQLQTVSSLNAVAAVVLNIANDHMDRHHNLQEYINAKKQIYHGDGAMIINLDDAAVVNMIQDQRAHIGVTLTAPKEDTYGVKEESGIRWIMKGDKKLIPLDSLSLNTEHNVFNAIAAMALAEAVDCPLSAMLSVLRSFEGLRHRCDKVLRHADIDWINDSKATNVAAACAAIKGYGNNKNIVLIVGGDGKNADFSALQTVAENNLKAAIVLGKDGDKIGKILANIIQIYAVDNLDMAVKVASDIAEAGDVVLLSPACSSHDMFENYQRRGQAFVTAIKNLFPGQYHV